LGRTKKAAWESFNSSKKRLTGNVLRKRGPPDQMSWPVVSSRAANNKGNRKRPEMVLKKGEKAEKGISRLGWERCFPRLGIPLG